MLLTLSINIGPCPSQSRSQGPIERTLETRLDPSESGDEDATRKQLLTTALSGRSERKNRRERERVWVLSLITPCIIDYPSIKIISVSQQPAPDLTGGDKRGDFGTRPLSTFKLNRFRSLAK